MKVDLLITLYNAKVKHKGNITSEEIYNILKELIKPIDYISYDNKLKIVEQTIKDSSNLKFPTAERYRLFLINVISAYTEIECDIKGFDVLCKNQLINIILSMFSSEFEICKSLMDMCINDLESG